LRDDAAVDCGRDGYQPPADRDREIAPFIEHVEFGSQHPDVTPRRHDREGPRRFMVHVEQDLAGRKRRCAPVILQLDRHRAVAVEGQP
ncbi:hypothetical protein LTR94_036000, partial [Friedmanniomyces endolithicus]